MLSLKEIKELSEEPGMTDQEAERLRSVCYGFARLALDVWRTKNKKINNNQKHEIIRKEI